MRRNFWGTISDLIRAGKTPKWFAREVPWLEELLGDGLGEVWAQTTVERRTRIWRPLILTALSKRPDKVATVLSTAMTPLPPVYVLNDVFLIIDGLLQTANIRGKSKRDLVTQTFRAMLQCIKSDTFGAVRASTLERLMKTLGRFPKHLSQSQALEIYKAIEDKGLTLPSDTALQFARRLSGLRASDDHRDEAIQILVGLASRGEDLMGPKVASVITSVLHQKYMGEKSRFVPTQVLQRLMESGFLPNAISVTAAMETLCERNEFSEAFHLAKLFTENGLKFDEKAFDILLKGARHTYNDDRLREALEFCKAGGASESLLAKHAIHAIYLRVQDEARGVASQHPTQPWLFGSEQQRPSADKPHLARQSQAAFIAMLRFYGKRFELGPLQSLIPQTLPYLIWDEAEGVDTQSWRYKETLLPLLHESIPEPERSPLTPCAETLALVLRGYVKSLWRPYDLMSMYSFFTNRLRDPEGDGKGTHAIVKARGTLIHDSFILAMMQSHALVRPGLEIFGDMLKDNFRDSESGVHPPPSVYTFAIILAGLGRHKERKLFDQIKQIMMENGVTPNLVTSNTLVNTYASRQDVSSTVGALRDLETLGYRPDQATFNGFAKLRDQAQALKMMSRIIDENQRKFLESGLEQHE